MSNAAKSVTMDCLGSLAVRSISKSTVMDLGPATAQTLLELSDCDSEEIASPCGKKAFTDKGFSIKKALGCGSMGSVYLVTRESDGQDFAAKRVSSVDEDHHDIVREEYAVMKELNHPSIVLAKELFEFPRDLWLVMGLCEDGNVQAYVKKHGAFGDERCRDLALQLLDGVSHLHQKRLVHRDIKTENLFLKKGASQLQIGDFNSASRIGLKGESVWMLSDRGTPLFSAPELRLGWSWNERVDVWASGLAICCMAQAVLPFNPLDRETTAAWRRGTLPTISWGKISSPLANLVLQCLTVEVSSRPAAMELLHHPAFELLAEGPTRKAAVPGARRRAASLPARRSTLAAEEEDAKHSDDAVGHSKGTWQSRALRKLSKRRYALTACSAQAKVAESSADVQDVVKGVGKGLEAGETGEKRLHQLH